MLTTEFSVTGMTCSHCENAVRTEVGAVAGVTDVAVDASAGSLRVTSTSPIDEADVLAAVSEAGYEAVRRA